MFRLRDPNPKPFMNATGILRTAVSKQIWVFPKMVVPNNHGFSLLKLIILGCFGGTIIFGNTHMYIFRTVFSFVNTVF